MKLVNRIILSAAVAGMALSGLTGNAAAAGDAAAGKAKSATCAGCHGVAGNSVNPEWPTLAGQNERYLAKQLAEFKDQTRKSAVMLGMAAALSEQDMADLAAYFASQTAKGSTAKGDLLELGEHIFRGGIKEEGIAACMACHGPSGHGNAPAGFPALAGQHAKYTIAQLKEFQAGNRVNDTNKMMRLVARKMSPKQMSAVAEYIAGLKP